MYRVPQLNWDFFIFSKFVDLKDKMSKMIILTFNSVILIIYLTQLFNMIALCFDNFGDPLAKL